MNTLTNATAMLPLAEILHDFRQSHPYRNFENQGVVWEYIASGEGTEALLILGGALSTGETSFQTIQRLERYFRVISPSYPAIDHMETLIDGLVAIMEHEGFGRANIFGHSLGAGIAHVLVRLHPERVGRMALDGFGLYTPGHTRLVRWFMRLPFPLLRLYYARAIRRLMAAAPQEERDFYQSFFSDLLNSPHTRQVFLSQFKLLLDIFGNMDKYRISEPVPRGDQVLLCLADDDRGFTAKERESLISSYPGAQQHRFTSGGHFSGFTHPDEFNASLDSFLIRQEST